MLYRRFFNSRPILRQSGQHDFLLSRSSRLPWYNTSNSRKSQEFFSENFRFFSKVVCTALFLSWIPRRILNLSLFLSAPHRCGYVQKVHRKEWRAKSAPREHFYYPQKLHRWLFANRLVSPQAICPCAHYKGALLLFLLLREQGGLFPIGQFYGCVHRATLHALDYRRCSLFSSVALSNSVRLCKSALYSNG